MVKRQPGFILTRWCFAAFGILAAVVFGCLPATQTPLFTSLWSAFADDKPRLTFSRPTVKGKLLTRENPHIRTIYKDHQYEFGRSDRSTGHDTPSFFVHDRVGERWIQITELSTEHARLGKSFDGKAGGDSDFRDLQKLEYISIPITIRGSKLIPDRVTFDQNKGLYRFDFNSQLNLAITLSYFWVSKTDLDALQ